MRIKTPPHRQIGYQWRIEWWIDAHFPDRIARRIEIKCLVLGPTMDWNLD